MKQQIHVRFMALSWHLDGNPEHGSPKQFHDTFMADSWHFPGTSSPLAMFGFAMKATWGKCHESAMNLPNLHETYMSDSSRIHRGFMALSIPISQNHVRFMALSWQFHGAVTSKPDLGTACQRPLKKGSKKSVLVVDLFCLLDFSFFHYVRFM